MDIEKEAQNSTIIPKEAQIELRLPKGERFKRFIHTHFVCLLIIGILICGFFAVIHAANVDKRNLLNTVAEEMWKRGCSLDVAPPLSSYKPTTPDDIPLPTPKVNP